MFILSPLNTEGFADRTKWCGPSLFAMIAGIPLKQAHEKLCMMTGVKNKDELGIFDEELILALAELGFRFRKLSDWNGTLRAYVKQQPLMERASVVIASVPGHILAVHMGRAYDNGNPKGCSIDTFKYRRNPVNHLYMLTSYPT